MISRQLSTSTFSFHNFFVVLEFEIRAFFANKINAFRRLFIDPLATIGLFAVGIASILNHGDIYYQEQNISYISYVFPGILTQQLFATFSHSVYRLTIDRRWGLQALKMISGTGQIGYILAMGAVPIIIFLIQSLIALPLGMFFGANIHMSNFCLAIAAGLIVNIFWTSFAIFIVIFFRNYSQRDLFLSFSTLLITLSAPIYYSLEHAPEYLQWISRMNPLTYHVTAIRDAFLFGNISVEFLINLFLVIIFFIISLILLQNAEFLPSET